MLPPVANIRSGIRPKRDHSRQNPQNNAREKACCRKNKNAQELSWSSMAVASCSRNSVSHCSKCLLTSSFSSAKTRSVSSSLSLSSASRLRIIPSSAAKACSISTSLYWIPLHAPEITWKFLPFPAHLIIHFPQHAEDVAPPLWLWACPPCFAVQESRAIIWPPSVKWSRLAFLVPLWVIEEDFGGKSRAALSACVESHAATLSRVDVGESPSSK